MIKNKLFMCTLIAFATLAGCSKGITSSSSSNGVLSIPTTLTFTNLTSSSVDVNWLNATDSSTSLDNLQYSVYYSTSTLNSVMTAQNQGILGFQGTDVLSGSVNGLTTGTKYYFALVVSDPDGNEALATGTVTTQ